MSPSPEQLEYAELLQRQAAGHLYACRALANHADVDYGVGLHAHHAIEKALRVALALGGIELPLTHDLDALAELVQASAIAFTRSGLQRRVAHALSGLPQIRRARRARSRRRTDGGLGRRRLGDSTAHRRLTATSRYSYSAFARSASHLAPILGYHFGTKSRDEMR